MPYLVCAINNDDDVVT